MNMQSDHTAAEAEGAPCGLLCDLLAFPERTEIATSTPTLGWMVNGGKPGTQQRAYRILVSRKLDQLHHGIGELWDSGRVESPESINIAYEGLPLAMGVPYFWTVCTWSSKEMPSAWAEPQRFVVGNTSRSVSAYPLETVPICPAKYEYLGNLTWLIDFGKAAFGWVEMDGSALKVGLNIEVRLGEKLLDRRIDAQPEGAIRYAVTSISLKPGSKGQRVELAPDLRNTGCDPDYPDSRLAIRLPKQIGVVMPFRYVELHGCPADFPALQCVRMIRVQYPFDEGAASFASSEDRLDKIWELCRYSVLATSFAGYYVDGDRERIPYEADAYINQLCHYAADREFSLARRTHEHLLANPTWPTEWKQHSILIAWADYEATGDLRFLGRHYETLKSEKLLSAYARTDGLLDTHTLRDIVDWPISERDGCELLPINSVVNAFHYRTLVLMSRIAAALGFSKDADDFSSDAARFKQAFHSLLFDQERGVYRDGDGAAHASLHANLFPLAFDLVPEANKKSVVAFIKSRGMVCSVYATQYLLEALFKSGEGDYALQLITSEGQRSWWNMLQKGTTITWEAWDQELKPNQDWNHVWGAAPGNIIPRYVLGVRPVTPGYGKISIEPQLGQLSFVKGTVPTIHGPVHVHAWRDAAGIIRKETSVPASVSVVD